jgi:hypothetical protein
MTTQRITPVLKVPTMKETTASTVCSYLFTAFTAAPPELGNATRQEIIGLACCSATTVSMPPTYMEAEWMGANFGIPRYCTIERKPTHGVLVVDRESGTRNCQKVVALDEDHAGVAKPCSSNDDSYVAMRVAEEASPVLRAETTTRDWKSYQAVDCNHTNSNTLEASVSLDPAYHERVTDKPTARYDGSDHIKDINPNPPAVVSYQGNTAKVQYGFNGEDRGTFGCPGGGHTTIVVTFPIERKVPAQ